MQAGMLLGRGALGGGSLLLMNSVGQPGVIALLVASVWVPMILLFFAKPPQQQHGKVSWSEVLGKWKDNLKGAVSGGRAGWGFLFALLAGAGFEGVGSAAGPFLLDTGSDKEVIARFFGIDAIVAMAAGALIGGKAADRFGRPAAATWFLVILSVAVLCLALVAGNGAPGSAVITSLLTVVYAGIGCFLAASFAFFMDLTSPRHAATQFSFFMAGTNLCESWAAAATGQLAARFGYPVAFTVLSCLSLGALPIIRKGARFIPEPHSPMEKSHP
jgi:MFS family permease